MKLQIFSIFLFSFPFFSLSNSYNKSWNISRDATRIKLSFAMVRTLCWRTSAPLPSPPPCAATRRAPTLSNRAPSNLEPRRDRRRSDLRRRTTSSATTSAPPVPATKAPPTPPSRAPPPSPESRPRCRRILTSTSYPRSPPPPGTSSGTDSPPPPRRPPGGALCAGKRWS